MSLEFAPEYEEENLFGEWGDAELSGTAMDAASSEDASESDAAANCAAALRAAKLIDDVEMVVVEVKGKKETRREVCNIGINRVKRDFWCLFRTAQN